ncbi:MAG TPA: ATP-dependent DNA ligase [Nannocystis exedens]|nr:ATP-dependent DNA ligase [Nannocystis exedens]
MVRRPGTMIGLGDRMIELSHENALMYPDDGITKGDLVEYYLEIAASMLPHVEDRPLTVERFTKGIGYRGFLQKNASDHYPDWIRRASVPSRKHAGKASLHAVCDDAATLIFLANQRCVTYHITPVHCDMLENPDRLIFDFDPAEHSVPCFAEVRRGAMQVAELLRECGLTPFVKTTGSKGLHVIAPLDREAHIDEVRAFGKAVSELVARRDPEHFTIAMSKSERKGRVFLDYLRNGYAQTIVAPYSLRPLPGAPVSMPLTWDELADPGLHARSFTLNNVQARLALRRDPWAHIDAHRASLDSASINLDAILAHS